jgi:3'-phosphoadenosine 5'-phosphosulfate sulfotransferase (PAPS reductase)/FAD synthetase
MGGTHLSEQEEEAVHVLDEQLSDETGFLWTGGIESQVIAHMLLERTESTPTFLTIDTGNQLDSVYEFREQYYEANEFEWETGRNQDVLSEIDDPSNEKNYHGEGGWTVEESCGALKTQPIQEFVEADGYDTLITGTRRNDPIADDDMEVVSDRRSPVPHTRVHPLASWTEEEVWAYITYWFVDYPDCYDNGIYHTDSKCCMEDEVIGEHGEGVQSQREREMKKNLQELGYI